MRDLLETALEQLQNSDLDKDSEIDRLKQFFIKFSDACIGDFQTFSKI